MFFCCCFISGETSPTPNVRPGSQENGFERKNTETHGWKNTRSRSQTRKTHHLSGPPLENPGRQDQADVRRKQPGDRNPMSQRHLLPLPSRIFRPVPDSDPSTFVSPFIISLWSGFSPSFLRFLWLYPTSLLGPLFVPSLGRPRHRQSSLPLNLKLCITGTQEYLSEGRETENFYVNGWAVTI